MNDFTMFAVFAGGVVAGLVAFSLFHIYRGLRDTLTNAKIGGVYNF